MSLENNHHRHRTPEAAERSGGALLDLHQLLAVLYADAMAEFMPFQPFQRTGHKQDEYIPFGATPHQIMREEMVFDPVRGGWVSKRVGNGPQSPWANNPSGPPPRQAANAFDSRFVTNNTRHFESRHHGPFRHNLKEEVAAGIVPPDFSVSSKMKNPDPKGKGIVAGYAGHVPHERSAWLATHGHVLPPRFCLRPP